MIDETWPDEVGVPWIREKASQTLDARHPNATMGLVSQWERGKSARGAPR